MFPKKTVLLLLFSIVLLSVAMRYPMVEHERFQTDSYFIHSLAWNIAKQGSAAWTFSPLSYVGYYPYSYPSGVPFVLAELSVMTGLDVDVSILIVNYILAAMFSLVVFCLSREFVHRVEFALLATLLASLGPRFVDTTYWVGSARGMEVVLIALLAVTAFRMSHTRTNSMLALTILIGFACFAVHHMAVLIILYGLAFVLADLTARYLSIAFRNRSKQLAITTATIFGILAAIWALNTFEILGNSLQATGETGVINLKIPVVTVLLNLVISYTHQMGLVLEVAALGVVAFLRAPRFFTKGVYPFAVLLVFVPVLGSSFYVSMLLAPFVAIVAVMWLQGVLRPKKTSQRARFWAAAVALLLASSMIVTVSSVDRWNHSRQQSGDTVELGDGVFNDANYLNMNGEGIHTVTNTNSLRVQLSAYAGNSFLVSGVQATIDGDITYETIRNNITTSTTPFPQNLYTWLSYREDSLVDRFVLVLMIGGVYGPVGNKQFMDYEASHSNLMVVVDNNWPTSYVSIYGHESALFPIEVRNGVSSTSDSTGFQSYVLYCSQRATIYMVHLPGSKT